MASKRNVSEVTGPRTLDVAGFAFKLGVSPTTFQRWKREQRLPAPLPVTGKAQLWDEAEVNAFVEQHIRDGGVPQVRDQLAGSRKPVGVPRYETACHRERHAQALLLKIAEWGCAGGAYLAAGAPIVWCALLCGSARPADIARQRARLEQVLLQVGPGLAWKACDMPEPIDGPQS